jgi:hypothetical protein
MKSSAHAWAEEETNMDSKQKKKINTAASGVQLPLHHKRTLARSRPDSRGSQARRRLGQRKALKDRQTTQNHE